MLRLVCTLLLLPRCMLNMNCLDCVWSMAWRHQDQHDYNQDRLRIADSWMRCASPVHRSVSLPICFARRQMQPCQYMLAWASIWAYRQPSGHEQFEKTRAELTVTVRAEETNARESREWHTSTATHTDIVPSLEHMLGLGRRCTCACPNDVLHSSGPLVGRRIKLIRSVVRYIEMGLRLEASSDLCQHGMRS